MARSVLNQMEKSAIGLVNQIGKTPYRQEHSDDFLSKLDSGQLKKLFAENHDSSPRTADKPARPYATDSAGGQMDPRVVSVVKAATVSDAIDKIRNSDIGADTDAVFIVDEHGKYVGHVRVRHLLTRPDQTPIASLADTNPLYVRVDSHRSEFRNRFNEYDLISLPVLDHDGRLVGRVVRNGDKIAVGSAK